MKVFLFRKSIGPHAYALICLKTPAKLDSFAIPCDIIWCTLHFDVAQWNQAFNFATHQT